MTIRDDIYRMTLAAKFAGPDAVLQVSLARYQWLLDGATVEDMLLASVGSRLVYGVEVVIDATLSGMDYRLDPRHTRGAISAS